VRVSFGPSALATPANAVTAVRLALTPVFLAAVVGEPRSWVTLSLWVLLAATDGLDGYLARRQGSTRSGAFLDPLADKVLVLGAMAALVVDGRLWWLPVAVIAVRELAMSAYRTSVGRSGLSIPARRSAKAKTALQGLTVALALTPVSSGFVDWLTDVALWAAVALTVVSGLQYWQDGRRAHIGAL
jgi:CDP-diacylglycerol---glycerol-3-phosphate 3-phosphatidyltransferase